VDAAWRAGLRYFDTAPLYGGGDSERRYGHALREHPRDEYAISTKVGREGEHEFDYSATAVTHSIRRSCERLGVARLDVVYLHDVDPDMHGDSFERRFAEAIEAAYPALRALRDDGVVAAMGAGLKDWNVALRLVQAVPLDCVMLAGGYTLLQHGALEALLPWCEAHSVSIVLAAPFNSGILAKGAVEGARYYYEPAPPEIMQRTRDIEAVCARHAVPLAAAALQFPLHHPAVACVVAGHERAVEVERNLSLMRHPIPPALWAELKRERLIPAHAPTP
jgi:D-threo-aldose 1-dehydrogenase